MNKKENDFFKAFYSDGFRLGIKAVAGGQNQENLFAAQAEMYAAIDGLIDSLTEFAQNQGSPIHCKKGCEWCCHQPVFALSYEMDFLNHFLRNNFDEQQQFEIREKAEQKRQNLGFLNEKEILNSKFPCPLLENGACSAYPVRPMACRIYLSADVSTCLKFYDEPENTSSFPALLDFPMRAGRMMNEGFKAALKASGIQTQEFRIEEKILEDQTLTSFSGATIQ
ncbi:MAG: YkgJ family cysteine cluster protein [Bacteroidia bacterium]|nr:YkgJ family cysteine cluster protein [Bacteroidia bacterium]